MNVFMFIAGVVVGAIGGVAWGIWYITRDMPESKVLKDAIKRH